MSSFIAGSPIEKDNEVQMPMGRQIQGGPAVDMGSPLTDLGTDAGTAMAAPLSKALLGTAGKAVAGEAALAGGTGLLGTLGASGAAGAAMAPMLAAAGPFALMALPFLLKDGTPSVPEMDYGPDPLQGYMNGTNRVQGYKNGIPGVPGLAGMAMDKFGIKSPMSVVGKALGFSNGTNSVPGYMNGTSSITPTTAMHLAGGKDTVPALLVPGEAVIGSAAAQNPANTADINRMLNETKSANLFAEGKDPNNFEKLPEGNQMASMSGPLSDKTQREQMLSLQKMSLINKAAEAEEARKQEIHELKLAQMYEKYRSSITT